MSTHTTGWGKDNLIQLKHVCSFMVSSSTPKVLIISSECRPWANGKQTTQSVLIIFRMIRHTAYWNVLTLCVPRHFCWCIYRDLYAGWALVTKCNLLVLCPLEGIVCFLMSLIATIIPTENQLRPFFPVDTNIKCIHVTMTGRAVDLVFNIQKVCLWEAGRADTGQGRRWLVPTSKTFIHETGVQHQVVVLWLCFCCINLTVRSFLKHPINKTFSQETGLPTIMFLLKPNWVAMMPKPNFSV